MIFPDLEETNNPLESNVKLENFVEEFEAEKELSEKKEVSFHQVELCNCIWSKSHWKAFNWGTFLFLFFRSCKTLQLQISVL